MNKPWLENITLDDMPNDDLKTVAELCGIDVAVKLITEVPGIRIQVPNRGFQVKMDKWIIANYDGTRGCMLRLALQCGVTDRYIQKLVSNHFDKIKYTQTSLFESK